MLIDAYFLWNMKAIQFVNTLASKLADAGINKNEIYFMAEHLCGVSRADLYVINTFTDEQQNSLEKAVLERINGKSLQNILGTNNFLDVKLKDDIHTLTPRPETEYMASIVLAENDLKSVLDICAGSGAIGLALAKRGFDVTLSDVSDYAIDAITVNAKNNNLKVKIIKSDMFEGIEGRFDIIVSNPPYIPSGDIAGLDKVVLLNDPIIALDGGKEGLDFYRIIADNAARFLNPNGLLYLEIGINQEKSVSKLLEKHFKNIKIIKDLQGVNRIIKAELK